jgi:DNA repair exonuclease SbcCD ATPase subunit
MLYVQELLEKNSAITTDLLSSTREGSQPADENALASTIRERSGASVNRAEVETLKQQLEIAQQWAEAARDEKNEIEKEYTQYREQTAEKDNDFKALSDAYNALEQENYRLEEENKTLRSSLQSGGVVPASPSPEELEAAHAEGRKEAQKESEVELNDLLVCLGQEETKVERLSSKLRELGEDVDALLEGIGDPEGAGDGDDDDEDDEEE